MGLELAYETLCVIWFFLLGILLAGYAVLDGFDLGVGIIHPFAAKDDTERRISMNSIGPLWDGNEVWLVTFGGAMFAMFPIAYASVFSGFYLAFVLLLFCLIFRAVSLEFRSKMPSRYWRCFWDWSFCLASFTAALLFGVAVGNLVLGIPLDETGNFEVGLCFQLRPYAVLIGLLTAAAFALHGAAFLNLKTDDAMQNRLHRIMWTTFGCFLALYLLATVFTVAYVPRALNNFALYPLLWLVPAVQTLVVGNIPRCLLKHNIAWAFVSSAANILALVCLLGIALYPYLVPSVANGAKGLTIFDAASSPNTLTIGLYIVIVGMPLVLTYTAIIYWSFHGKTRINTHSY